jgi:predicted nucleic acid-binding protein
MRVDLDSVIVIYVIEGIPAHKNRANLRLAALRSAGDRFVVSDLTFLECRVKPLQRGDVVILAEYDRFLGAPDVDRLSLPMPVFDRATLIRADHGFKLGDALHLAAAIESGCDVSLTRDVRLGRFLDLAVEVLP